MERVIVLLAALIISGCGMLNKQPEYIGIPIGTCPAPPTVERPELYIDRLVASDIKDPGKVAQYFKITSLQLQAYAQQLEYIVSKYGEAHENFEAVKEQLSEKYPDIKIQEITQEEEEQSWVANLFDELPLSRDMGPTSRSIGNSLEPQNNTYIVYEGPDGLHIVIPNKP